MVESRLPGQLRSILSMDSIGHLSMLSIGTLTNCSSRRIQAAPERIRIHSYTGASVTHVSRSRASRKQLGVRTAPRDTDSPTNPNAVDPTRRQVRDQRYPSKCGVAGATVRTRLHDGADRSAMALLAASEDETNVYVGATNQAAPWRRGHATTDLPCRVSPRRVADARQSLPAAAHGSRRERAER